MTVGRARRMYRSEAVLPEDRKYGRSDHWHRLMTELVGVMRDVETGEESDVEQIDRARDDLTAEVLQMPKVLADLAEALIELSEAKWPR